MKRRDFLRLSIGAGAFAFAQMATISCTGPQKTKKIIKLPQLPYKINALEPYISSKTVDFHYSKHHAGYVKKLNLAISGTPFAKASFYELIKNTYGKDDKKHIFNNAAQTFNHNFYWKSMKPGGGGAPKGKMAEIIKKSFGSYDKFKQEFSKAALTQFGSGWAWIVKEDDKLKVIKTANADTPIAHGLVPVLTIDIWEHAYYLDYQNRRGDYIKAFIDHLINWEFAEENLA